MHSSEAPPCYGPHKEPMPAEIQANGLAKDEPAILTAVVDGPWSQSAWRIKSFSVISMKIWGSEKLSSIGSANIMFKKFST